MAGINWLRWQDDFLTKAVREVMHDQKCASHRGFMVGGISFDVNDPPHAREVKHKCDCRLSGALARIGE